MKVSLLGCTAFGIEVKSYGMSPQAAALTYPVDTSRRNRAYINARASTIIAMISSSSCVGSDPKTRLLQNSHSLTRICNAAPQL